jgi:hypothetical protein
MNLTIAPFSARSLGKRPTPKLRRASRVFAALLCFFLLTSSIAQAGPVRINQVVQTLNNLQGAPELSLITQDPVTTGTKGSTSPSTPRSDTAPGAGDPKLDSLLSGFTMTSDTQQIGVDIGEEGEVEGTICDCGEILIAGGGFPKWPLLFLAAVPLAFIDHDDDCEDCSTPTPTPTPTPNPSPTPTPTPEPASLLLFGSGLLAVGAGLRRRYTKSRMGNQKTKEDGESE